jgi:hypothetical protein
MAGAGVHVADSDRLSVARAAAARHPHVALLVSVLVTLATEPAVQAGRDAASNIEYAGAALGLAIRGLVAGACLFVAWEGQRLLRLRPVLGCGLALGLGWLVLHLLTGVDPDQDLTFYAEDGRSLLDGTYPSSEYPAGAVGLFAAETWVGGEPPRAVHAVVMLAFHLAAVAAIWSLRTRWSSWLAALVAVWPLNLFHWEFRYDLAPAAFLVVGLALAFRERWSLAGLALGVGTALKWSPALAFVSLAAWLLVRRRGRETAALVAGFAIAFAALTVPFLLWQPGRVIDAYQLQGGRGLTGESLWFLVALPVGLATAGANVSDDAGATDALNVAVTGLQTVLVLAVVVLAARARERSSAVGLAALAPAAFLLTNRVFSSQFLVLLIAVWAFSAALVVASSREQLLVGALACAATLANALVHPYTLPWGWELASASLFALALGLTAWLVTRAVHPAVGARAP